jgi:iron complex transport system substrate-binding protein
MRFFMHNLIQQAPLPGFLLPVSVLCLSLLTVSVEAKPVRIVSINLCSDQLVMLLAEPEHILSLSHLAADPNLSFIAGQLGDIPLNEGRAEQIVPLQADLVLAGQYGASNAIHMLKRLGFRVESIPLTFSSEDVKKNIRQLAALLEVEQKGEQLIAQMEQRIRKASAQAARRPRRVALIYGPNGYTSGKNTLSQEILNLAGLDNLAAQKGIDFYGNLSLETVLESDPDILIINDETRNKHSLAQRHLQHPALQRWLKNKTVIKIPPQFWICGGPMMADAVEYLVAH